MSQCTFTVGEINIICSDLAASLHFYCDLLGFEVVGHEGPGCHLKCGSISFLLLAVAEPVKSSAAYCSRPEISIDLMVEDIAQTYDYLSGKGVRFVEEFERSGDRFFIRDPDGIVLEVIQSGDRACDS